MKPSVQHFEINSKDYKKAQQFYREVFDWDINEYEGMTYALVTAGEENSIGGGINQIDDGQKPSVTFYVTVDDIEKYLAQAKKAGGKIVMPLTPIKDVGYFGMFADLDGNVIGLYKSLK